MRGHRTPLALLAGVLVAAAGVACTTPRSLSEMHDVETVMDEYDVPGVGLAVLDGEKLRVESYGVADLTDGEPLRPDTRFQAASISKLVTAVCVVDLAEEGRVSLDRPVNELLRSWQLPESELTAATPVTLRRLLAHRAGTTVSGFRGYAEGEVVPTLRQVLDGTQPPANSAAVEVDLAPDTRYRYSGGGYCVVQQCLEDVTDEPFQALLAERVLRPAGMDQSTFEARAYDTTSPPVCTGHRMDGEGVVGRYHTYPEQAAAGLWTTPRDLVRLARVLVRALSGSDESLLSGDSVRAMIEPASEHYGLGAEVLDWGGERWFGHSGRNEGFESYLLVHPTRPLALAVMINSERTPALETLVQVVARREGWPGFAPDATSLID